METSFVVWICEFFADKLNIDLNRYRTGDTKRYDTELLLFLDWNLVEDENKKRIIKVAQGHKNKFEIHNICSGLECISKVLGNRRT